MTASRILFLLLSLGAAGTAGAADLSGKIFSVSDGPACEAASSPRTPAGTLPELKKYLARKSGVYCVSWPVLKADYEAYPEPAVYVGRTGDVSEFYLNGKKIGLSSPVPSRGWFLQSVHSCYYLPRWLLGETNTATLKIDKFFRLGSGPLDGIEIGDWDAIRRKTRLMNYAQTDLLVLVAILAAFLGVLILVLFRRHPQYNGYRTFSFACFAGALFSLSLSRALYFFVPDVAALFRANCVVAALFFYFFLDFFYGPLPSARRFRQANAAGSALFVAGLLFSPTLSGVSKVYAAFLTAVCLHLLLALWHTLRHRAGLRDWHSRGAGIAVLAAALLHDILVYTGLMYGANFTPYGIFGVLFAFIFIVLTDMEQIYLAASRTAFAVQERNKMKEDLTRVTSIAAVGRMAAQVAHDIRSPLAALDAALKNAVQLPEEQRLMVRHAVNRIRDIANNLLEKTRLNPEAAAGGGAPELCLLSSVVDPVVTEKRLQFGSRPGVQIDLELDRGSYGLFARVQPVELGRLVSNLVNNAVEALGEKGRVRLGLSRSDGQALLTVADDGPGIPAELLEKLGRPGATFGKAEGHGLGLYHARAAAEAWGGSLHIASGSGGTTVTVSLPLAETPPDFVSGLELAPGGAVVVLDDDSSIHQVWKSRFREAGAAERDVEVVHFMEPARLRNWVQENPGKAATALYLFDQELIGFRETGLSLAAELGLGSVILVTSSHDDKAVAAEAARLKIRVLPKSLAGLVPVSIKGEGPRRAVLLDDDMLVRMNWKLAARAAGVEFSAYATPGELEAGLAGLPADTPLYIDSELGGGVKGEEVATDLRRRGYTDISLSTGHPPEKFAAFAWLKVSGKEPPWA